MTGKTISHYEIEEKLGQGGMGVVYKARDVRLGRVVALKFLPPGSVDPAHRKRFIEEARNASFIQHPNICPVHDIGEADGQLFLAMAHIDGVTLSSLTAGSQMEIHRAIAIAVQVASALEAAHKHGIVHRDIKSSNIMVTASGHAYVLDFGLAFRSGSTRLTTEGGIAGTPSYMSPEQAQGAAVDHRTDVWSLGVVLFEMLTGRLPFKRDSDWAAVHAIIHDPAPAIGELRPEVNESVREVIRGALEKDPANRWQSAAAMAVELGGSPSILSEAPTQVLPRYDGLKGAGATVNRRRWVAGAAAAAVVTGGVGIAWRQGWLPGTGVADTGEKNIAVLPFLVIGDNVDVRAIADGLVESITARLSQLDQFQGKLLVIPSSEIRSRKINSAEDARKIYGANLVITGSALLVAGVIQFTVTLVETAKMRNLGARTFEFDLKNPSMLRDGAMEGVFKLLEVQMTLEPKQKSTDGETANAQAYADFLKGSGYLARYDVPGNIDLAVASLQQATKKDPNYANAYGSLARAFLRKARSSGEKHWADRAVEAAQKGVKLAPDVGSTHVSLGEVLRNFGKEDEAIEELQKGMKLSPGNAEAYRNLAQVLTNIGRVTEAETLYREAIKRHPTDWYAHFRLAMLCRTLRRYDEAEKEFKQALNLAAGNVLVLVNLATMYMKQARYPEARILLQDGLKSSKAAATYSTLGLVYYYEHRFKDATDSLEAAVDLDSANFMFQGNLGIVTNWTPGKQAASEPAFRRAIELGEKMLQVTPRDYSIRADLAEYYAHLKDPVKAAYNLEQIPAPLRSNFTVNFALVYELLGKRKEALAALKGLTDPSAFNEIRDDADLKQLWADPELQALVARIKKSN